MENKKIKYEFTGGRLVAPIEGEIEVPPTECVRKDIETGDFIIKVEITPRDIQKKVEIAKKTGKTEIDVSQKDKDVERD